MESQPADPSISQKKLEKRLRKLEEENRNLAENLDVLKRRITNTSAFHKESRRVMSDTIKRLETERDKVWNELTELKEENDRYKKELDEHDRRSRDKRALEITSDTDMEEVARINLQLLEEIREIEHRTEILISTIAALTTTTQMMERITEEYQRKVENQRKELTAITEEGEGKEAKRKQFENKVKIMEADVERKTAEVTRKKLENSVLEESILKDEIRVEALKAIINEHQRKGQQIGDDFEKAQLEFQMVMNEKQTEIDDIRKQIADLQAKELAKKKPALLIRQVGGLFRRTKNGWNGLFKKD